MISKLPEKADALKQKKFKEESKFSFMMKSAKLDLKDLNSIFNTQREALVDRQQLQRGRRYSTPQPAREDHSHSFENWDFLWHNRRDEKGKSIDTPSFYRSMSGHESIITNKYFRQAKQIDYDVPERYLFEFYTSKRYFKFRKDFMKYSKHPKNKKSDVIKHSKIDSLQDLKINKSNSAEKTLFLEIEGTIVLLTKKQVPELPVLAYVNEHQAAEFDMDAFYVHVRPFSL
mmetsp:Transcript_22308/g.25621  ORF Transcript_22308/g.25621 Transcript_22308/m.25621 type:complete len:230 (-) Transcript_22308:329-1018(-)